jgi:hypothetical protein
VIAVTVQMAIVARFLKLARPPVVARWVGGIMRRVLVPAFSVVLAVLAVGCGGKTLKKVPVFEPLCNAPQKLNRAGICVDCVADADCAVGKACNLITGTCQPIPPPNVDAGPRGQCQVGAVRCAQDGRAVQTWPARCRRSAARAGE